MIGFPRLSSFFLIGCLAVQITLQTNIQERDGRGGLPIDSSCDQYKSQILEAIDIVRETAKAGYKEAESKGDLFNLFFRNKDEEIVLSYMRSIVIVTNSFKARIPIRCVDNSHNGGTCLRSAAAMESDTQIIYLCLSMLDEETTRTEGIKGEIVRFRIAEYLMHEMLHTSSVSGGDGLHLRDITYDAGQCINLVKKRQYDSMGVELDSIRNVNNFVWMATLAQQGYDIKCQDDGIGHLVKRPTSTGSSNEDSGGELRKLQGANNSTKIPDGRQWLNETDVIPVTSSSCVPRLIPDEPSCDLLMLNDVAIPAYMKNSTDVI